MKKLLAFLILFCVPLNAQVMRRTYSGATQSPTASSSTQALNTATTFLGFSVQQLGTKNISSVEVRVSAVSGTLTSISCVLESDNNGVPNNDNLETVTKTTGLPAGAANLTFTFAGTTAMTDGSFYWLVLKNGTGTPASNNYTVQWLAAGLGPGHAANVATAGFSKALTTDGTTWGTTGVQVAGILIGYSDGTYDGLAANSLATDTSNQAFGSNEVGVQFTSPANVKYNVIGFSITARKTGTPTGNLIAKLYTGSTPSLLATSTTALTPTQVSASIGVYTFLFSSPQAINSSTIVTITIKDTAADSSSNAYRLVGYGLFDTTAASLSTVSGQGTFVEAIYNGSVWSTSTSTLIPTIGLLLDPSSPYLVRHNGTGIVITKCS